MSSLRKFLSFAVVLTMVLGIMAPAFAAPVPEDAVGTDYEDAARRLAAFEIMVGNEFGSFDGARKITRAEMTKIVVAMQGMAEAAEYAKGATPFEDVVAGDWESGFVNVAYTAGMVKGTSETTFEPKRFVTYNEVLTMIVRACGYTNLPGNWPVNFVNKAAQMGITSGIPVYGNGDATRAVVAQLVNKALDAKTMEVSAYDANGYPVEYKESDKTVLEKYFDLTEVEGVVLYTYEEDPDLDEGEVVILVDGEEEIYTEGNDDMTEYLGRKIVFYIDDPDAKEPYISGIKEVKTAKRDIIEVDEFGEVTKDSGQYTIQYTDTDDDDEDVTASDVYCVFNGRFFNFDDVDSEDLEKVLITAHPNDNLPLQETTGTIIKPTKDIVFVIAEVWTEPLRVTDVTVTSRAKKLEVEDADKESANFDLDEDDVEYTIILDGEEIDLEDVEEDDVVEICVSRDGERIEINVTRDAVWGTVESIGYKAAGVPSRVRIDGTYYVLNSQYALGDAARGSEVTALLDAEGEVEYIYTDNRKSATGNYAIVLEVEEQTFTGKRHDTVDDEARVLLLLEDGTKKRYRAVDNLVVYNKGRTESLIHDGNDLPDDKNYNNDGEEVSEEDDIDRANVYERLVKYETNSDGLLSRVTVVEVEEEEEIERYREGSARWGGYIFTEDTVIFYVTEEEADAYKYTELGELKNVNFEVVLVDNTRYNELEVVIIREAQEFSASSADWKVAMVVSRDELDDKIFELGLTDGEEEFILETDEDIYDDVDLEIFPLELVVYTVNSNDEIDSIALIGETSGLGQDKPEVNILFDGSVGEEFLVTSVNASKGLVSVSDGTYDNAITEYFDDSTIVFDISDWRDSSIKSSSKELRVIDLNDIEEDTTLIQAYRVEIDSKDYYYIVVTEVDVD